MKDHDPKDDLNWFEIVVMIAVVVVLLIGAAHILMNS